MTGDDIRPWLAHYPEGIPADLVPEHTDALDMFRAGVERHPDGVAVSYFGGEVTRRELDEQSDALASALLAHGVARGDRVAAYLQNVPQFVITMVATWAGGTMVSINSMSRQRELAKLLLDSGSVVLVCLDDLYADVAREVVGGTGVHLVVTTSALEHRGHDDPRLFTGLRRDLPRTTGAG